MIEIREVTKDDRDKVLRLEEGHFLDVKSRLIRPATLSKSISAFANAAGGELFIGIDEDKTAKSRSWSGFETQEDANGHLQLFEEVFPLGTGLTCSFLRHAPDSGLILHAIVEKAREIIYSSDGVAYVRRGAQNLPVKTEEALQRLRLDKGLESFEERTVDAPLDAITDSLVVTGFIIDVVPSTEAEPWLRSQQLVVKNKPTVAGCILFADEPQALLPKRCGIKIYRHETRGPEGTRDTLSFLPRSIEGCAYTQISGAVAETVRIIETISVMGPSGFEKIKYPAEALHEIITNAVLHRDYSIATDVQVRIFDNRIEVESPGKLPGHVTEANILAEQLARNPRIVRLINKFPDPPNKDVGEGLNTAFEAMKKLRLKEPLIKEREHSVLVVIRHEPLASPEEAIIGYLANHEEISNAIGRELTGITSENAVKEVFYRLRDQGLIERTPGKRGSASTWRKVGPKAQS
jgi:ATP-dependent DNA helicase RecG